MLASHKCCCLLITFANSLDPDQAQQNVRPDLYIQTIWHWKYSWNNFWRKKKLNHYITIQCKLGPIATMIADPGIRSSITAWSHAFAEIDHEIISTFILLLLIQEGLLCAGSLVKLAQEKSFLLVRCFTSQSTAANIMLGWSVHLTTLVSWASLTKQLTSTSCTYFRLLVTTTLLESVEGRRMTVEMISWSISTKVLDWAGIELMTPGSTVRHVPTALTQSSPRKKCG